MENKYVLRSSHRIVHNLSYHGRYANLKEEKMVSLPVPVNQVPTEDFCLNKYGYPMSDIQRLMIVNSDLERDALIRKIRDGLLNLTDGDRLSKMSIDDKLLYVKPRWVDTPTERAQFAEYVMNSTGQSLDDLYKSSEEKRQSDLEKSKQNENVASDSAASAD